MQRDLPSKLCAACGRSFTWRRKWARDWDQVRYCSDACRSGRYGAAVAGLQARAEGAGAVKARVAKKPRSA